MTRDTLWLGCAYEFVRIYFLAIGVLSDSYWQICTRWLCFFYRKSMVGRPRPRFCCLQCHIISYVRSCCTTACCRRLCYCYLQLHMRCCGCSLLHRCQCRYEETATTAAAVPLCTTTVVVVVAVVVPVMEPLLS